MISEPVTMFTDYLITLVAWSFSFRLYAAISAGRCQQAWAVAFLCIGCGALLGGTSHGFDLYLNDTWKNLIWKGTIYTIGFSMFFAVAGTIRAALNRGKLYSLFAVINVLAFLAYALWMATHDDFLFVIVYYVPAMLIIASMQLWALIQYRVNSAKWLLSGVIVTLMSAYIQQSDIDLHANFNHNDLYHVIQVAGLYLLFRGAAKLVDRHHVPRQNPVCHTGN